MRIRSSALVLITLLSGCAVKGDYSCGIPQNGVGCQPLSTTSSQLTEGSLASLHSEPFALTASGDGVVDASMAVGDNDGNLIDSPAASVPTALPRQGNHRGLPSIATIDGVTAILSPPRELRIWFNRFTDADGDLHDESFVFIRIDNGHWVIDDQPVLY